VISRHYNSGFATQARKRRLGHRQIGGNGDPSQRRPSSRSAPTSSPNDTNQAGDVFVHDRQTGETTRVSLTPDGGNRDDRAFNPSISDDGRYVGFASKATNLVAGSPSNLYDAYVRDRQEAVTVGVSIADDGSRGNSHSGQGSVEVSGNGRHVVLDSVASNRPEACLPTKH
jgi:Tol biopolymer transport system component